MQERQSRRQTDSTLGTKSFDSEMIEAARLYHLPLAKGYMPVEVAGFIAEACWAKRVLVGEGNNK